MIQLNASDLAWLDEDTLLRRLRKSPAWLRLEATIFQVYESESVRAIADNWLKAWFVGESLAACAKSVSCSFREGERGAGEFILDFRDIAPDQMAVRLLEFAGAFDPDDLEAMALIYNEAEDWLEKRGNATARFPQIEEAYRTEAARAAELEDDGSGDDS
jgi:hypothetical protein